MKYKNTTGQEVQIRLDDGNGSYIWKIIEPNQVVEMPEEYANNIGFTSEVQVKVLEVSVAQTKVETKQADYVKLEKDIDSIKGIGKKRAKLINKEIEEHLGVKNA